MTKSFRLANCSFSSELRYRQVLRGIGVCGIATLLITAKLQEHGHLVSIDSSALQSLFSHTSATNNSTTPQIGTYTASQTVAVASINNLLSGTKPVTQPTQGASSHTLPLNWSIVSATIKHSFSQAALQAGLTTKEVNSLKALLANQIDFTHFKPQDQFKVLLAHNSNPTVASRTILAVQVMQGSHALKVFQYRDSAGTVQFYQADGHSLNPGFLRYPTHFIGIGSGFSSNRLDPITGHYHSHPAIDFRAPMGTPIVATGNGRISMMAWENGYGNVVKISHAGQITTLYAHMKGFAKDLHAGSTVKSGQVIGYVGMTGYATGPHVHYEFRVNGKAFNPLTIKLPGAPALSGAKKQDFLKQISPYQQYL